MSLIYVVGASRSGTTMLATILGRNCAVHDIGETHYLGDLCATNQFAQTIPSREATSISANLYARSRKTIWRSTPDLVDWQRAEGLMASVQNVTRYGLLGLVASDLARSAGKIHAVEQTPRNIYYADQILAHDPESRIIEIVRDPRAVLHSQRQRWRMRFLGAPNVPYSESLRTFVNYHAITMALLWRAAVRAGLAHGSNPRYMRIRYEDLISDPEGIVVQLCAFLGIPFETDMLEIPRISSSTAMNANAKTGISKDSINRWQEQLPAGDRAICARIVGREAQLLDYSIATEPLFRASVLWHMMRYPLHLIGSLVINPRRIITQVKGLGKSLFAL